MIVDLEPMEGSPALQRRFAQPGYIFTFATERARLMGIVAGGVLLLVLLYLLLAPREYSGRSMVIIDPRKQEAIKSDPVLSGLEPDATVVETELQMLQSRSLAEQVGKDLGLDRDADFIAPPSGLLRGLKALIRGGGQTDPGRGMTDKLLGGLDVARVGTSYAISIGWTGDDPGLAARIANQYAQRYIINQVDTKDSATAQVNSKIRDRLDEIRKQLTDAEARVVAFRQKTGLISAMDPANSSVQIGALGQQAALARAQAAEQAALLAAAQRASGPASPAAQASQAVQTLRAQQGTIEARAAELNTRYGPQHPLVQQVAEQQRDIAAMIDREVALANRGAQDAARAAASAAGSRAGSSASSLGTARGSFAANNVATVRLAELERDAAALTELYQSYLSRYKETGVEVGMQSPDARIISRAVPPFDPSSPNIPLTFALGILLALFAGIGAGIIAELLLFVKLKRNETAFVG
ncbi:GumC family protein [Rhizorhabdus sp.]|uniref:GumC family protein n=1 Tax=Rhizorhabdus sp. TaxID=1968843 RepID=UPI0019C9043A|nr:GumC family protein [Rhizorhabdus sp.]MBD3762411.1 GumC family protein [Rhizorhabdus sp.]